MESPPGGQQKRLINILGTKNALFPKSVANSAYSSIISVQLSAFCPVYLDNVSRRGTKWTPYRAPWGDGIPRTASASSLKKNPTAGLKMTNLGKSEDKIKLDMDLLFNRTTCLGSVCELSKASSCIFCAFCYGCVTYEQLYNRKGAFTRCTTGLRS